MVIQLDIQIKRECGILLQEIGGRDDFTYGIIRQEFEITGLKVLKIKLVVCRVQFFLYVTPLCIVDTADIDVTEHQFRYALFEFLTLFLDLKRITAGFCPGLD